MCMAVTEINIVTNLMRDSILNSRIHGNMVNHVKGKPEEKHNN